MFLLNISNKKVINNWLKLNIHEAAVILLFCEVWMCVCVNSSLVTV